MVVWEDYISACKGSGLAMALIKAASPIFPQAVYKSASQRHIPAFARENTARLVLH